MARARVREGASCTNKLYSRILDKLSQLRHRDVKQDRPEDPRLLLLGELPLAALARHRDRCLRASRLLDRAHQLRSSELRLGDAVPHCVQADVILEEERDVEGVAGGERERGDVGCEDSDHVGRIRDVLLDLDIEESMRAKLVQRENPVPEEVLFRGSHVNKRQSLNFYYRKAFEPISGWRSKG